MTPKERIDEALNIIHTYGAIDGGPHKEWMIDQVVRVLAGSDYTAWIAAFKAGHDGPDTFEWSEGLAP